MMMAMQGMGCDAARLRALADWYEDAAARGWHPEVTVLASALVHGTVVDVRAADGGAEPAAGRSPAQDTGPSEPGAAGCRADDAPAAEDVSHLDALLYDGWSPLEDLRLAEGKLSSEALVDVADRLGRDLGEARARWEALLGGVNSMDRRRAVVAALRAKVAPRDAAHG